MFKELIERVKQGYKTVDFPNKLPEFPEFYKGKPSVNCKDEKCKKCVESCPVEALKFNGKIEIDLGKCIFCNECTNICPTENIVFSKDYKMSATSKENLIISDKNINFEKKIKNKILKLFNRSFKIRVVSAGGCGACEADVNVLSTIGYDLGRFGIEIVASPRHADGLIVIGPVTKNMETALFKTYKAIAEPKLVIAVGSCAISGGIFCDNSEQLNGADSVVPVDLYIPGCPPNPFTILDGILTVLDKY